MIRSRPDLWSNRGEAEGAPRPEGTVGGGRLEKHGKFGKDKHFELTKKALIHVVDNYWETFGVIQVENKEIYVNAHILGLELATVRGTYTLHPDIVVVIRQKYSDDSTKEEKVVIVEAETSLNGLLKDEMRLTAYKLLRLGTPDKRKLMLYIALPSELKRKVEKPEYFNDFLFFDVSNAGGA